MADTGHEELPRGPVIEPNGSEYAVGLNGRAFLALAFAAAERMARRTGGPHPARRTPVRLPPNGAPGVVRR